MQPNDVAARARAGEDKYRQQIGMCPVKDLRSPNPAGFCGGTTGFSASLLTSNVRSRSFLIEFSLLKSFEAT